MEEYNLKENKTCDWHPKAESVKLLDWAIAKIKSVPYRVPSRWTFYRLVQAGFVTKKKIKNYDYLLSKARKNFFGEWKPDTLVDSMRRTHFKGGLNAYFGIELDSIKFQDYYVQLWFEAEAMYYQFEYYTKPYRVSLVPFRGDCSIPIKWEIAKKLELAMAKYQKPIKILYFGDYDTKGFQIIEAALKDIRAWCNVPFDVERVGLTQEQVKTLDLPDNPDKPGTYQWEAVEDEQAKTLILESLLKYQKPIPSHLEEREKILDDKIRPKVLELLKAELENDE